MKSSKCKFYVEHRFSIQSSMVRAFPSPAKMADSLRHPRFGGDVSIDQALDTHASEKFNDMLGYQRV